MDNNVEYELKEVSIQEGGSNLNINTPSGMSDGDFNSGANSPDIVKSENDFDKLAESLEKESKQYFAAQDNENNAGESEEDFKLRRYFENSQRMALSNGSKPKKMVNIKKFFLFFIFYIPINFLILFFKISQSICIRNLTVVGRGADLSVIADLLTPFNWFISLFKPSTWKIEKTSTFNILNNVTCFNRDGQMLLVLGRPGAGCSVSFSIF